MKKSKELKSAPARACNNKILKNKLVLRKRSQITIFIIIAILVVAMVVLVFTLSSKFKKAEEIPETEISEKIYCKPEQRNADVCIQIYEPVCGWFDSKKVQCIRDPCAQTYSNFCFACMNKDVEFYTAGECE